MAIIKIVRLTLLAIIVLIIAAFTALNAQSVEVKYLIGARSLPLAIICFIALLSGLLLGYLIMLGKVLSLKKELFLLKYKMKQDEELKH